MRKMEQWTSRLAGTYAAYVSGRALKGGFESVINIVDDYNPTNGDKIREMTDSELAQIIMCPHDIDPDICIEEKKDCYECCLEYLQQPAVEEN